MTRQLKVYLAGWDVFRPDSVEFGKKLKDCCEENSLIGLYPLDNHVPDEVVNPQDVAAWIYKANIDLIKKSDIVMANINSFRGAEPDSGTAFEIGFARALEKKVYIYLDKNYTMIDNLQKHHPEYMSKDKTSDKDGRTVENFDLPVNLMISVPSTIFEGNAFECIKRISEDVQKTKLVKRNKSNCK